MLSLLKRSSGSDQPEASELARSISLLLEALAVQMVNLEETAYVSFRDVMRSLRRAVEEKTSGPMAATGNVIRLFEAYSRNVEKTIQAKEKERFEIVSVVLKSLVGLAGESRAACKELNEIEQELGNDLRPDELRTLRNRLSRALQALTSELEESASWGESRLLRGPAASADTESGDDFDPVTGLSGMAAAERAIADALTAPAGRYLGVLSLERLKAVNSRYGRKVGDQMMFEFAQDIAQHFSGNDRLFRWGGPTFVALVERPGRLQDVRAEMGLLAAVKRDRMIEFQGHEMMLSISARAMVIALAETPVFEKILETLNTVASYSSG